MGEKTESVQMLFFKRTSRFHGTTSSSNQNDMMDEIAHDLGALSEQINNSLVPVMAALPDGTIETTVDAFVNGLDGGNIYVDFTSSPTNNSSYYNDSSGRPNTILEQFVNVYVQMSEMQTSLEASIADFLQEASLVTISDVGGLYSAGNVEAALTEVMEKVNLIALGQVDLIAIDSHYIPVTDNTFDIGTSSVYMRSMYSAGLALKPRAAAPTALEGTIWYDSVSHTLKVHNGTSWQTVAFV